nr:reverse transcriptase domain-containing protein [Tanacetum cinerariifolium]
MLVMHTEEDDTVLHKEKTGMWMLAVEIDVGGMTADVFDELTCLSDDVQPRQVDLSCAHALTELHWHDTHVDPDRHEVDQYVLMMMLVMHTKEDDTVLHMEKTGMWMLAVEIDVGGMTADVVDKLTCLSDDVQPRQVDLSCAHALTELHWHDTRVDPDRHEVDQWSLHSLQQLSREEDRSQQILESSIHVVYSTYTVPFGSSMSHTYPSPASELCKLEVGKPRLVNRSLVEIVSSILIWNEMVLIVTLIELIILIVRNGRKTRRTNLIRHHWRTIAGISLVVVNCEGLRDNYAWDRFKDLFRAYPHHGFSELHQLDTFYNALNSKDQDSLNFAAGGNFLDKMPCECLDIIESKSKVCYSHNKPVVAKVSTSTSTSGISPDVAELKDMMKALLLNKKSQNQSPAPVKAVEESCVTCGGAHSYRNYLSSLRS